MSARILLISYDTALRITREKLLSRQGYMVATAGTFASAAELCSKGAYDLVIVGHSMPPADKRALLKLLKETCASPVPALLLLRANEAAPIGAIASVDSMETETFLSLVNSLTGKSNMAAQ